MSWADGIIDSDLVDLFNSGVDAMLNSALADLCTFYYEPTQTDCPNCIFDSIGKKSSGKFQSGGPRPFPTGSRCPVCNGAGTINTQQTETTNMLVYWTPKEWRKIAPEIEVRDGETIIMTCGYIKDMPKAQRCQSLVVNVVEANIKYNFELYREITPNGLTDNRYFYAFWKRSG